MEETLSYFISELVEKNIDAKMLYNTLFREQNPTVFGHTNHTEEERFWLVFFFIRFCSFYAFIDFIGHKSDVSSSFIQSALQFNSLITNVHLYSVFSLSLTRLY